MKTSDFKWHRFPFYVFNPAQSKVVPHVERGVNLVVSFPPGAGKTAVAEACFAYHLKTSDSNAAYVSPLKSLASQKLSDWKVSFNEFSPFLVTGDSKLRLSDAVGRLGVFTAESFDSGLRRDSSFTDRLACVCFDEAHLIGDGARGSAYESSIIRLSEGNARIVLLSGTLGNAREMAEWLKRITGRDTALAVSDWRPVKLKVRFHYVDRYAEADKAVELAKGYTGKTIIFVHSKDMLKKVSGKLKGVRHAVHHGSLSPHRRSVIEKAFAVAYSGVDVLVSTSTLSAGVNI